MGGSCLVGQADESVGELGDGREKREKMNFG